MIAASGMPGPLLVQFQMLFFFAVPFPRVTEDFPHSPKSLVGENIVESVP